ncbi:MAG: phosphonate ABC transporter ATP-binding protein [Candidatus Hydrogenedentota bacterium]|nr:MAG: phosphonate ABC transporter ATP-binding protein [Candidatus Hydrogenedentota bacterium]
MQPFSSTEAVIKLQSVRAGYGNTCVLSVDELSISSQERVFILGRSGSGKTTLSRLIKGRIPVMEGELSVLGESNVISNRDIQRRIAMVDQDFNLIPRLTLVENVLTGALGRTSPFRTFLGWYPASEWEKAESILAEVGLDGLGNRRIDTLSGGQQQRAAIARALMQDADIIIADEPVSNLDPELAEDALALLVACTARREVTLLVNLHQPRLARKFATRVLGLADGCIVYDGDPENLSTRDEEFIYRESELNPVSKDALSHDTSPAKMA